MTLPLNSGPKLAVGQRIACWSCLPEGSSSTGGNSVCCLVILVIFIGLGRAYRLGGGGILKLPYGWQAKKEWDHFYGGSWPSTTCKDFNLVIVGGLRWMKWLKMGKEKVYISCNYSCTLSFLVKILLVKLKWLYIQYAWISMMKKTK